MNRITDWRERAACKTIADPRIFEPTRSNTPQAVLAAAHCASCPVAADCYADAADFGRTDGIVQGGHFWVAGKPHEIRGQTRATTSRSELAQQRRTEAFQRFLGYRGQGITRRNAVKLVAAQYEVTTHAVYDWIRQGVADASRANAAKATAGA